MIIILIIIFINLDKINIIIIIYLKHITMVFPKPNLLGREDINSHFRRIDWLVFWLNLPLSPQLLPFRLAPFDWCFIQLDTSAGDSVAGIVLWRFSAIIFFNTFILTRVHTV